MGLEAIQTSSSFEAYYDYEPRILGFGGLGLGAARLHRGLDAGGDLVPSVGL